MNDERKTRRAASGEVCVAWLEPTIIYETQDCQTKLLGHFSEFSR